MAAERREILIAEDNPADVRLMEEALRVLNPAPELRIVRDGEQALDYLSRKGRYADSAPPFMVFLDFHLPRVDSRDVLTFVKNRDELRDIAVVVLTTSNAEELIREAYRLGANCYLSKPSDLDDFLHTIRCAASYWLNFPVVSATVT